MVGTRFQGLFHSPPGVLFTIPSRYFSAIGHRDIFRLTGWSRQIHSRFHGPAATRGPHADRQCVFTYGTLTLYGQPSQATSTNTPLSHSRSNRRIQDTQTPQHHTHNPRRVSHARGLAILRVRSPLLTESQLFSSPTGTEMFHFPAFPPAPHTFRCG